MKLEKKLLAFMSLNLPALETDKEGRLKGGFCSVNLSTGQQSDVAENTNCNCGCDGKGKDTGRNTNCDCNTVPPLSNTDCNCNCHKDKNCEAGNANAESILI